MIDPEIPRADRRALSATRGASRRRTARRVSRVARDMRAM